MKDLTPHLVNVSISYLATFGRFVPISLMHLGQSRQEDFGVQFVNFLISESETHLALPREDDKSAIYF